ncbi:DUF924 family protein [Alkalimarinus sediminis]|uniref:DUF924 domain-containing protein n=1 Tax=Alkalimarinus sediminis TaxID=1632866 RepID=A0A9E8HLY5_9ALTE|nr:DUF924 family protein [Alkalimarinus sediminis]UZW75108.1 DUF924 domain-containing protein [Alkalimarinus sediminis]
MTNSSADIIAFWFDEITPKEWFIKDLAFDQIIRDRFLSVHQAAVKGELYHWRLTAEGCLAEIIILDQFSRNMFRDKPEAFAYDNVALVLAQRAVELKLDQLLPSQQRAFLYMPYMHSESVLIHEQAVKLFDQPGLENNLQFEYRHKEIIDRFGRYPHRNAILGRESTTDELNFLESPGSSF